MAIDRIQMLEDAFLDASYNKRDINYIISGDSLRGRPAYTDLIDYAGALLQQINITDVYLNATPSMTSTQWASNSMSAKMQDAIDMCRGVDGRDTIIELSFGFNDVLYSSWTLQKFADGKANYIDNINTLLSLKPKVNIILVSPNATKDADYDFNMQKMILEISNELGLATVDMIRGFENVRPSPISSNVNNAYYSPNDSIHLNDNGGRRLYNWLISNIIPKEIAWKIKMFDYNVIESETPHLATPTVLSGGWKNTFSNGQLELNGVSTYRCFSKVLVYEDQLYYIKFDETINGRVAQIRWVTATGSLYSIQHLNTLPRYLNSTEDYWLVKVPKGVVSMHVTISSDGTAYDASGDIPVLHISYPRLTYKMSLEKINIGLNIMLNNN